MKTLIVVVCLVALVTSAALGMDFSNQSIGRSALNLRDIAKATDQDNAARNIYASSLAPEDPAKSYSTYMANYDLQAKATKVALNQTAGVNKEQVMELLTLARKMISWIIVPEIVASTKKPNEMKDIVNKTMPKDLAEVKQMMVDALRLSKALQTEEESADNDKLSDAQTLSMADSFLARGIAVSYLVADVTKAKLFMNFAYDATLNLPMDLKIQMQAAILPTCTFDTALYEKCRKSLQSARKPADMSEENWVGLKRIADLMLVMGEFAKSANAGVNTFNVQTDFVTGKMSVSEFQIDPSKLKAALRGMFPEILRMAGSDDESLKLISSTFIVALSRAGLKDEAKKCWSKFLEPLTATETADTYGYLCGLVPMMIDLPDGEVAFKEAVDRHGDATEELYPFLLQAARMLDKPISANLVSYVRSAMAKFAKMSNGDEAILLVSLGYAAGKDDRTKLFKEVDEKMAADSESIGSPLYLYLFVLNAPFDASRARNNLKQAMTVIGDDEETKQQFTQTAMEVLAKCLSGCPSVDVGLTGLLDGKLPKTKNE